VFGEPRPWLLPARSGGYGLSCWSSPGSLRTPGGTSHRGRLKRMMEVDTPNVASVQTTRTAVTALAQPIPFGPDASNPNHEAATRKPARISPHGRFRRAISQPGERPGVPSGGGTYRHHARVRVNAPSHTTVRITIAAFSSPVAAAAPRAKPITIRWSHISTRDHCHLIRAATSLLLCS
jgi:hypothetical protein